MKGKFIIILLLILILGFTVYKMMEFESEIRQERTIKLYVEDESKPLLAKFSDEEIIEAAANSDYYFAVNGDYFKMLKVKYPENERLTYWENIFIKGVNLGVAVPGKFPAEFSLTYSEYLEWMKLIGDMNANTIRTYTMGDRVADIDRFNLSPIFPAPGTDSFHFANTFAADSPIVNCSILPSR